MPAVLFYNYYLRRVKSVIADLDEFAHDFINLAQRATYRIERNVRPADVRSDARHHSERLQAVSSNRVLQPRSAEQV